VLRQGFAAQIGWRCDHDAPGHADFSGDQRAVGDLAATNGKIDPFLDQIGVGVVHHEIQPKPLDSASEIPSDAESRASGRTPPHREPQCS